MIKTFVLCTSLAFGLATAADAGFRPPLSAAEPRSSKSPKGAARASGVVQADTAIPTRVAARARGATTSARTLADAGRTERGCNGEGYNA